MDTTLPNQQLTEPQVTILRPSNRKKAGLLKIILAGIIIIIFLGILSYLNILPRQQEPIVSEPPTTQQPSNFTPQEDFQYDTKKAEMLLTEYIKDNIKPEHLPAKINVQQKLISTGELKGTDYEFGANWEINKDAFFQSNFHYELDTNKPRDMEFSIQLKNISDIIVNSSLAQDLTATYLKNLPKTYDFDCGLSDNSTLSFCENFYSLSAGKKGFGVVIGKNQPANIVLVFSCFIPKESVYYAERTSCLLFREKT